MLFGSIDKSNEKHREDDDISMLQREFKGKRKFPKKTPRKTHLVYLGMSHGSRVRGLFVAGHLPRFVHLIASTKCRL